jgi:hypothetical protein
VNWLALFEWCEGTAISTAVRESVWLFPVIEAGHLIAFAVIGGAVLLVDLRLLGFGLRRHSTADVEREARPWLIGSLGFMVVTGTLLFLSEAVKCYYSEPFWIKMTALGLATIFTFTARNRIAGADEARISPAWAKLAAVLSISLWGTVAWGGRWIGFSG